MRPMRPYEIVEHTADIGVRATGRTPEELFTHMAQGMFSLIVPPEEVQAGQKREIVKAQAEDWEALLVAWLKELLYLFDTRHFLPHSFAIRRLEPTKIEAELSGETLDPRRHSVDKEVKAVTYCGLALRQEADVWSAQVILDI